MNGDSHDDDSQRMEMLPPDDDHGFYTSQVHDWVPLSPQLKDSAVRLYWIMRALVIEKRGPVRKLTLLELCHLLPARPVRPGEQVKPSSLARIRSLLDDLSRIGLVSTPEGGPIKTSSRAGASGAPLRIRINNRPRSEYGGPRNAFELLDEVRGPAAAAAAAAVLREAERKAARAAETASTDPGQISSPGEAGQISGPGGQKSGPGGQISGHDSRADLQDHEPPLSPSVHTLRSDPDAPSVRPSVQVEDAYATDGRTDGDGDTVSEAGPAGAADAGGSADAGSAGSLPEGGAPDDGSNNGAGTGGGAPEADTRHARQTTPGHEVLTRVGRLVPELALAGRVLTDQARRVDELIAGSEAAGNAWWPTDLVQALAVPLGEPIRRSAGAVISARITALPLTPRSAMLPQQTTADRVAERSATAAAGWSVEEATSRRTMDECPECGAPSPGKALCGQCAGWPECVGGCGRRLPNGGRCESCTLAAHHAEIAVETDDGRCPGHDGVPCGRPVVSLGLCRSCRFAVEKARQTRDAEWAAEVDAAAVRAAQPENAPF
ncbi:hypothetical protein [Streptomyces sp. DW26H14]|uniref:hypothetical protein n=1 Tax=Streptomyces sp. DW26H14 TaxID=3435395 RepID=UPI00403D60C7